MLISVVNHTSGTLSDEAVQEGLRAVNRQIAHDFSPHWHLGAELRLEGPVGKAPNKRSLRELRGDAIIYLWDDVNVEDALGYHDSNARGVPFGFVFTELVKQLEESWTVTLSHEALELIADPEVNLLVAGPHPADPAAEVFHWYEMCDAVQAETYKVDGVEVSNFVLPLYFTPYAEEGGRNDFLGRLHTGHALPSFGINPGGYIGFYNPATQEHETFALKDDHRAQQRQKIKSRAQVARRSARHKSGIAYPERIDATAARSDMGRRVARGAAAVARDVGAPWRPEVEKIDGSPERPGPGAG
jgi:hypothetical protein